MISKSRLSCLDPATLRVSGVLGHYLELTWRGNLLKLDWEEDFLAPFQNKNQPDGYVGLGKTLEGLTRLAYHTQEPELLALRKRVVGAAIAAQEPDGYLGIYTQDSRTVMLWDVHEQAYLILALVTDTELFGDDASRQAAVRLGDYLLGELDLPTLARVGQEEQWGSVCDHLALLGLDRAWLALHRLTGDATYLEAVTERLRLPEWDLPIIEGRRLPVKGHMYAYLTRCLAQLELYELTGDDALLSQTSRAIRYLYDQQALVITGTNSLQECWHSDHTGCGNLGETCANAYLIRVLAKLLCLQGDGPWGDRLERTLYNALFAAQSLDGRQLRYYTPFEGERPFYHQDTYCCPANYRRIIGELPDLIAFQDEEGVLVNLYTTASLTIDHLTLYLETDYPLSGRIRLRLEMPLPRTFRLRLRRPAWATAFEPRLNGKPSTWTGSSHYPGLHREWTDGDTIELDLPMPWRLVRGQGQQQGKAALLRGPVVYCLAPERQPSSVTHDDLTLTTANLPTQPLGDFLPGTYRVTIGDHHVILTPFTDPAGQQTYFPLSPGATALPDELHQQTQSFSLDHVDHL